jgi:(E)-4-hydroxy-3-methylbut-2-enyl-diphosphate synthase
VTLKGDHIAEEFQAIVEQYVQKNYAEGGKLRLKLTEKTIPVQAVN